LLTDVPVGGVVHLCNAGACSWQEYGQHALDCAARAGLPLRARTVAPIKLAEMKTFTAQRPVHTVLGTEKLIRLTGVTPRSWEEAVEDYVRISWTTKDR
jgi:dTDP-4-dehydrorhamnose reductase